MLKLREVVVGILPSILFMLATASAWEIPLTVENSTRAGVPPFVSGGVPLLAGQAKETSDLRLAFKDSAGQLVAIPAQFRVLARYWRTDCRVYGAAPLDAKLAAGESVCLYQDSNGAETRPAA